MSNTRSLRNRSSRYSSPATFADSQEAPPVSVQQQQPEELVDAESHEPSQVPNDGSWVEPPVRNAVASFEDTKGLERMGVLEHMQPLGMPPTSKALARLKITMPRASPSARATPLQSEDIPSPVTETARTEAATPVDPEILLEPMQVEEPVISSPPRGRPAKRHAEEMRQFAVDDSILSSPVKTSPHTVRSSPKPASIQEHIREERMRGYINQAVSKAGSDGRLELIPGLTQVFEEAKHEQHVFNALEAILHDRVNVSLDQFKIFKHFIKKGIRRHRRSSTTTTSPSQANSQSPFVSRPQPVAYVSTFSSRTQPSISISSDQPSTRTPLRLKMNHTALQHSASPSKSTSLSPTTNKLAAAAAEDYAMTDEVGDNLSPSQDRAGSEESTSSLSSAQSVPNEYAPADVVDADSDPTVDGRPTRSTGQRQGANRVAGANRTRLSGIDPSSYSHTHDGLKTINQFPNKKLKLKPPTEAELELDQEIEKQRRSFENDSFYNYNYLPKRDSSIRSVARGDPHPPADISKNTRPPPPVIHASPLNPSSATLSSPASHFVPDLSLPNGTGRKRTHDEIDSDHDESTRLSPSPAPSQRLSARVSGLRSSTPRAAKVTTPLTKNRKSARVMISPHKPKNGGTTAGRNGLSRAGIGRDSLIGNGADTQAEDNEEFCRSCGGEGTLLCCDGCTNSFHHECLEPPLDPDTEIEGSWYCPECVARRNKEPFKNTGLLSSLVYRVEDTIPKAYTLPLEIRDYFEGIRTGDDGEYEEIGLPRTQKNQPRMNRQGLFEAQNYKELRDSKGNFRLCYKCGLTADGRDIIPCDFCPNEWHLDCVDPPLAVPPRRIIDGKQSGSWRCPLHIEDDLKGLSRQVEAAPGDLGKVPRLRRPKEAKPKDLGWPRGFRNNGIIDVELEKDEMPDIKEVEMNGGVSRLPERGIRLDFIDRVKQKWYEDHAIPTRLGVQRRYHRRAYRPDGAIVYHPATHSHVEATEAGLVTNTVAEYISENATANAKLRQKSFMEQRVALSLVMMSGNEMSSHQEASVDAMTDLINQLVADAPEEVESLTNRSEREQLLQLQEQIQRRLAILNHDGHQSIQELITEHPSHTSPPVTLDHLDHLKAANQRVAQKEEADKAIDPMLVPVNERWLNGDIATALDQVNGDGNTDGNDVEDADNTVDVDMSIT